jgi:hypothetical protein
VSGKLTVVNDANGHQVAHEVVVGGVQQPPVSLHMPTDGQNEPRAT